MIRKIRVLVVDDAVVVRKMLSDAIGGDPSIEVVGTAANGSLAMQKLVSLKPDLVTLDIEMAGMDGLATLSAIREADRTLPVIMFSTLTERGAVATLEAIARGATDYVTKPSNVGSAALGLQRIRDELIPKIKALCGRRVGLSRADFAPTSVPAGRDAAGGALVASTAAPLSLVGVGRPPLRLAMPRARTTRIEVLAIGVSTGGPSALAEVLPNLPRGLPVPVVIVQHMPPVFTRLLAERLAARSSLPVVEATAGEVLTPGKVWIAPGDFHLTIGRSGVNVTTRLDQAPPENSCRPAVDVLFRSVVGVYGAGTMAVVLTGMGADGLRGCDAVRAAGGQVVVQDEESSVVWGMPGIVATSGLADRVLPLGEISGEIVRRIQEHRSAPMQRAAG